MGGIRGGNAPAVTATWAGGWGDSHVPAEEVAPERPVLPEATPKELEGYTPLMVDMPVGQRDYVLAVYMDSGCGVAGFISPLQLAAMPEEVAEQVMRPPSPGLQGLCSADGGALSIPGQVSAPMWFGGQRRNVWLHVMVGLAVPILIGNAYLQRWGAVTRQAEGEVELRALGVILRGSCRTTEWAPQPQYGQRLTVTCVRDTALPYYTERLTELCFRDSDGRRVRNSCIGEMLPDDGAELTLAE